MEVRICAGHWQKSSASTDRTFPLRSPRVIPSRYLRSTVRLPFLAPLLHVLCFSSVWADINFPTFPKDPQGVLTSMRMVQQSSVEYYSEEFVEMCPEVGSPAIQPPSGISQRFEHPQIRSVGKALPDLTYYADDQLDNPFAGRIYKGEYTEKVITKEFIPDGDILPLPHNRTQLCHYAMRLTIPASSQNSAIWHRFKQVIAYGFETEFHFRVFHRAEECMADGHSSEWCHRSGADGFAFVIQNNGRKSVGDEIGGMGYGFSYNLAVEFDMFRNQDLGEKTGNHISVQVPPFVGAPNTADHGVASIAYNDDIPKLQEGTHVVRIVYNMKHIGWDDFGKDYTSDASGDYFRQMMSGAAGLLTVELDGRRVINVLVDLIQVVRLDSTNDVKEDSAPKPPDIRAYDEQGSGPGKAWVGFTSSTNFFQYQSVDILSWTFKEEGSCPEDDVGDIMCRVNEGVVGHANCTWDNASLCGIIIQNAGRQPIKFSAQLSWDLPHESTPCEFGMLRWNPLHPYFLGCSKMIRYTHEMTGLWITSIDGSRSLTVTQDDLLQKSPTLFQKQSTFKYCVMEHKEDPFRLQMAQCNCEYCYRLLYISNSYSVFNQFMCSARYGLICQCFEASEVMHDSSRWMNLEPLRFMRVHICRGCAFTSHCSLMLKVGLCELSKQGYRMGNPMAPTIYNNTGVTTFAPWNSSLDGGREPKGMIRGDGCNCEPQVRPYRGDPDGRSGTCSAAGQLVVTVAADLAGCAAVCASLAKCRYLTFWQQTGECRVYSVCYWQLCTTDYCFSSSTFQNSPLGNYMNMRGEVIVYPVFLKRTLQTTFDACKRCLHLYEQEYCLHQCGPPTYVPYMHWPNGQSCSTCIFAANRMHELTPMQKMSVKDCVLAATRDSQDPWVVCDSVAREEGGAPAIDLFNGVATHYLSECPGRSFLEAGAVCVPNLYAMYAFNLQILSRMEAINDTIWTSEMQCLNAVCDLVPKSSCYVRLAVWPFNLNYSEIKANVGMKAQNNPPVMSNQLMLNKTRLQYLVSDPLPFDAENSTIEAWVQVSETESIGNILLGAPVTASSLWETDFLPDFVTDGDLTTYWSSQIGEEGFTSLFATLIVDLGKHQNAGGILIQWKELATDFQITTSDDGIDWTVLLDITDNENVTCSYKVFFGARFVGFNMTKAGSVRGQGFEENKPVISIWEIEITVDTNVARLRDTSEVYRYNRLPLAVLDGDWESYWATPLHTPSADIFLDFGALISLRIIKFSWRYTPFRMKLFISKRECKAKKFDDQIAGFVGAMVLPVMTLNDGPWTVRCLWVQMDELNYIYGEQLVGLRQIEAYSDGANLAPNSSAISPMWPPDSNQLSNVSGCLDGDPTTYWLLSPALGNAGQLMTLTLDLNATQWVLSVQIIWASINGSDYFATRFITYGGVVPDAFFILDVQRGNIDKTLTFQVFQQLRYIKLEATQVLAANPGGQLALQDIKIFTLSDNVANRSTARIETSSAWANCADCIQNLDGNIPLHDPGKATDGSMETWWGLPYGYSQTTEYLEVTFPSLTQVDIATIYWRFTAGTVRVQCSAAPVGETGFSVIGTVLKNLDFVTPIKFLGTYGCSRVRFYCSLGVERLGGRSVIGIREVGIYSTATDILMNGIVVASDGSEGIKAIDESDSTSWISKSLDETTLTFNAGDNFTAWGARVLMPSTGIISAFLLQVSDDGETFETVYTVQGNIYNELWLIKTFSGRYIRLVCQQSPATAFFIRSFRVYDSYNVALDQPIQASASWSHDGKEAVDGDDSTFWLSEPFAETANLRLDLSESTFVANGMELRWMYPPEDFALYLSNDTANWTLLYNVTGNVAYRTFIDGWWEARYVECRMTRASRLNGDGLFGLSSLNAFFDPNIAHFKPVTVSSIMPNNQFDAKNILDLNSVTFWMPQQVSNMSYITIDLLVPQVLCGFDVIWRRPPKSYRVEYLQADTNVWVFLNRWSAGMNVGRIQNWQTGFAGSLIRFYIEEIQRTQEGDIVAMEDVVIYFPTKSAGNIALKRNFEASQQDILGNIARYAVDGDQRGSYWQPGWGVRNAWFIVYLDPLPPTGDGTPAGHDIGWIIIWWRYPPIDYSIDLSFDNAWTQLYEETNVLDYRTQVWFMHKANAVRITVSTVNTEIGIMDIAVYGYEGKPPPAVQPDPNPWITDPSYIVDKNIQTYWMGPPMEQGYATTVLVDLGKLYNATDIQLYMGFRPELLYVYKSVDGVNFEMVDMNSGTLFGFISLAVKGISFPIRFAKIFIQRGFRDSVSVLNGWGSTIRDFAIIQFSNIARGKAVTANSIWRYAPQWTNDAPLSTGWISRFGENEAYLTYDLGRSLNVAGFSVTFGHIAARFRVMYAETNDNTTVWARGYLRESNGATTVVVPASGVQFRGRYVRLELYDPVDTRLYAPDHYGSNEHFGCLFSVYDFQVFSHPGGGGVIGFQSEDGMQYTTITYALRMPNQWIISSEQDLFTQSLDGNSSVSDVARVVHVAMTLEKVAVSSDGSQMTTRISLYHNGVAYGEPYYRTGPSTRLTGVNKTRVVIGLRSSAYTKPPPGPRDPPELDPAYKVINGRTLPPYFSGSIYNISYFKNALSAEEVRGLYTIHALKGGQELGCHCFDACPTGANQWFPQVQVPCSGQGACRRTSGQTFEPGVCECTPGYSGKACEHHCSTLSIYGCCEIDDDCPVNVFCNETTKACSI